MISGTMHRLEPVRMETRAEDGFVLSMEALAAAIDQEGLDAYLLSNPCNPTGCVL